MPLSKVARSIVLGAEGGSFCTRASQHPFPCPNFPDQLRLFFRGSGAFLFQRPRYPRDDAHAQARSFKGSLQQNRRWPLPCACPPLSVSPSRSPSRRLQSPERSIVLLPLDVIQSQARAESTENTHRRVEPHKCISKARWRWLVCTGEVRPAPPSPGRGVVGRAAGAPCLPRGSECHVLVG